MNAEKKRFDLEEIFRGPVLPPNFGDGWMSRNGEDMFRIAVTLAGFDTKELIRETARLQGKRRFTSKVNEATVLHAMSNIRNRYLMEE